MTEGIHFYKYICVYRYLIAGEPEPELGYFLFFLRDLFFCFWWNVEEGNGTMSFLCAVTWRISSE